MTRKRPLDIRAFASEDLARLTRAALETFYPKARNGYVAHAAHKLWIVASDAKKDQFDRAAAAAWGIHCKEGRTAIGE